MGVEVRGQIRSAISMNLILVAQVRYPRACSVLARMGMLPITMMYDQMQWQML